MTRLKEKGVKVIIFEPSLNKKTFHGFKVINDFESFENKSDLIVANRLTKKIEKIKNKVFTRDIFKKD